MKVSVSGGSWAKRYMKASPVECELPESSTVADMLKVLPLPPGETGFAAIGGRAVRRDHVLSEGDRIVIYPLIAEG